MAILSAAQQDLDRMEALLETVQEGAGCAATARMLGLTRAALDEYLWRLRSGMDGPENTVRA